MKNIDEMDDVEIIARCGLALPQFKGRMQKIIARLTVPEDLEEAAAKLYTLLYPSGDWKRTSLQEKFKTLAAPIWPHLATGLKPGDEVRVRNSENAAWYAYDCWFVGRKRNGMFHVENRNGCGINWNFCEPIPKPQTYFKSLSEIICLAETGEFGWLEQGEIKYTRDGIICSRSLEWLSYVCGKVYGAAVGFVPDIWKEKK